MDSVIRCGLQKIVHTADNNVKIPGGTHRRTLVNYWKYFCHIISAQNGNLEVPINFSKAKQVYTVRKRRKDQCV
jgi:hypothetical protein